VYDVPTGNVIREGRSTLADDYSKDGWMHRHMNQREHEIRLRDRGAAAFSKSSCTNRHSVAGRHS